MYSLKQRGYYIWHGPSSLLSLAFYWPAGFLSSSPPCFSHKHSFKPLPLLLPELFCRKSQWVRFPAVVKGCFSSSWIFCEIYKIHILWEEIYSKVTDERILACKDISVCNFDYTCWRKNFERKNNFCLKRREFFFPTGGCFLGGSSSNFLFWICVNRCLPLDISRTTISQFSFFLGRIKCFSPNMQMFLLDNLHEPFGSETL